MIRRKEKKNTIMGVKITLLDGSKGKTKQKKK